MSLAYKKSKSAGFFCFDRQHPGSIVSNCTCPGPNKVFASVHLRTASTFSEINIFLPNVRFQKSSLHLLGRLREDERTLNEYDEAHNHPCQDFLGKSPVSILEQPLNSEKSCPDS
jgi:hypothetical protein